jgi:hypothetical protein
MLIWIPRVSVVNKNEPDVVAHIYNPSYIGGIGRRIEIQVRGWWSDSSGRAPAQQAWGHEFKLQ